MTYQQLSLFSDENINNHPLSTSCKRGISMRKGSRVVRAVSSEDLISGARLVSKYGIPMLAPCIASLVPQRIVAFSKAFAQRKQRLGGLLHFYEDDYKFQRLWARPKKYLSFLRRFRYVIEPDFSLLIGMPQAEQIYNLFRNHTLAYWMQTNGIQVVPQACWSDGGSFEWAYSGLPNGGTIAISMTGAMGNNLSRQAFQRGLQEFFRRIKPDRVWLFGLHRNVKVENYVASFCKVDFISTNYHNGR